MVVQPGILAKPVQRFDRSPFRIETTKNQPPNASLKDRPNAHDARFQSNIKGAVVKTPGSKGRRGALESRHLRVRGRTLQLLAPVMGPSYHSSPANNHRADRYLPFFTRPGRLIQGKFHIVAVWSSLRIKIFHNSA